MYGSKVQLVEGRGRTKNILPNIYVWYIKFNCKYALVNGGVITPYQRSRGKLVDSSTIHTVGFITANVKLV